jgi:hypothetical protein
VKSPEFDEVLIIMEGILGLPFWTPLAKKTERVSNVFLHFPVREFESE